MDDSWGNILYLILMVLFVVFGALKKKKPAVGSNPAQGGNINPSQSSPKQGLDSVLEALLGNEIQIPHIETVVHQEEVELTEKSISDYKSDKLEKELAETPKKSVFDNLNTFSHEKDEVELENSEWQEVDWRKAIIYKEILDRKYN